jgi:hypothetical protein
MCFAFRHMLTFSRRLIWQVSLGDERRVRARDPRRPRAMEVTTSCVPRAVPAADLRLAVLWAHPGFSEQQATSHTTPANSQGGNTGRCGAGSVLQFVCSVFGVIPNAKTRRFGI